MDEICKKYKIQTTSNYICLNDLANKIIQSKNTDRYIKNIKQKKQIGNKYYVTKEKALSIIKNSTSKECKKIVNECLKGNEKNNNESDRLGEFVGYNEYEGENLNKYTESDDSEGYTDMLSPFRFNNKIIKGLIDINLEYWFNGKELTDMFELKSYPADIFSQVTNESILQGKDIIVSEHDNELDVLNSLDDTTFYVNEAGIYELILCSSLPDADKLREWLTGEVLQSLFDTGSYSSPNQTANPFDSKKLSNSDTDFHANIKELPKDLPNDLQKDLHHISSHVDTKLNQTDVTESKVKSVNDSILDRHYELEFKKVELEMYKLQIKEKELDLDYMKLLGNMEQNGITVVFEDENFEEIDTDHKKLEQFEKLKQLGINNLELTDLNEIDKLDGLNKLDEIDENKLKLIKDKAALVSNKSNEDSGYDSDESIDMIEPYSVKKTKKKGKKTK